MRGKLKKKPIKKNKNKINSNKKIKNKLNEIFLFLF